MFNHKKVIQQPQIIPISEGFGFSSGVNIFAVIYLIEISRFVTEKVSLSQEVN